MATTSLPRFSSATTSGDVTEKSGYHQPDAGGIHRRGCGCKKTTDKGAYRDVTVEMPGGQTVHFYHQTPVVIVEDGEYTLNSGGYRTRTTKERINGYIPSGYYVRQEDFEWYVETPDGDRLDFADGMTISP